MNMTREELEFVNTDTLKSVIDNDGNYFLIHWLGEDKVDIFDLGGRFQTFTVDEVLANYSLAED